MASPSSPSRQYPITIAMHVVCSRKTCSLRGIIMAHFIFDLRQADCSLRGVATSSVLIRTILGNIGCQLATFHDEVDNEDEEEILLIDKPESVPDLPSPSDHRASPTPSVTSSNSAILRTNGGALHRFSYVYASPSSPNQWPPTHDSMRHPRFTLP